MQEAHYGLEVVGLDQYRYRHLVGNHDQRDPADHQQCIHHEVILLGRDLFAYPTAIAAEKGTITKFARKLHDQDFRVLTPTNSSGDKYHHQIRS